MKVAFVVQRYGLEVNGGSEFLCRQIAERMSKHWNLEVITTCALDYTTWEDYYPPGITQVNGVSVRRFRVDFPRSTLLFNRNSDAVYTQKNSVQLEENWAMEQGPYSSDFLRFLKENQAQYDLFFFFTYLYGLTYFGLPLVANKSILIPTAHDEPPFHLSLFKSRFTSAKALLFQTPEERDLVLEHFNFSPLHEVVSVGIDPPSKFDPKGFQKLSNQHGLEGDYILYLGRIDESKGCLALFRFFKFFREKNPGKNLKLVLLGKAVMPIPVDPGIIYLGFLDESIKYSILAHAAALVMPSPYESLSLVTLEAWSVGVPVIVNGQSNVLKGQCQRSGGGLCYDTYEEFEKALIQILENLEYRKQMGKNGFEYVKNNYLWNKVEGAYMNWAERVIGS